MNSQKKIYLDYNATTPVDQRVVEAMLPYFTENFGNASSGHVFGWDAEEAVELSREQIASLLGCRPSEITFTSGATEAANLALFGFAEKNKAKGRHIITAKSEHKAILDPLRALEKKGFSITYLEVDAQGHIDLATLEASMTSETILVCLMLANNETGLLHPIREIASLVHGRGVKLMCDITQAVGKVPLDLKALNVDLAIFSSHKLYGPKGVGALYSNKTSKIEMASYLFGGGQEKGLRPGTLNVPGIVGFGKAAEIAYLEMDSESRRLQHLRDQLEEGLLERIEGARINCQGACRLPNTVNISFENINGDQLIKKINTLAVSTGSACSSNTLYPSHVLKAMGLSDELALSSLRISLGKNTAVSDIRFAVEEISTRVNQLKTVSV